MNKRKDYISSLLAVSSEYEKTMDAEGALLVKNIQELLKKGSPVVVAVETAVKQRSYSAIVTEIVTDSVFKMALAGYGIPTSIRLDASVKEQLTQKLTEVPWAKDKMKLSTRLHGINQVMREDIVRTIQTSLNKQAIIENLSMALYDGYKSGKNVIGPAELPAYLKKLYTAARSVAAGDKSSMTEFEKALGSAKANIEKMAARNKDGTPNTDMMLTYQNIVKEAEKLVTATGKLNNKALDNAVWTAVQEKSRYHADRIARTEDARAWFDGFILETQEDELVFGYRWVLSNRHKLVPFDQCDVCANMDVGYGPGIFPKNRVPSIPRHPHCMCSLEIIYWDEVDPKARFNPDGARQYIDSLSQEKREALFGANGAKAYEKGDDWQKLLRGWDGFEDPSSRLTAKDMMEIKAAVSTKAVPQTEYEFFGGKKQPARIETYQGLKLAWPSELDERFQPMTMNDVKSAIDFLPQKFRDNIREIQLLDYRNPSDEYWAKAYSIKDFYSFAVSGGQARISIFASQLALKTAQGLPISEIAAERKFLAQHLKISALPHEAGHIFDKLLGEKSGKRISEMPEWRDIMERDFLISGRRYCSQYAGRANSPTEDFAEAIRLFIAEAKMFQTTFPNRAKWIEEALSKHA